MAKEFFGDYDIFGKPVYEDIHGRISIPKTRHTEGFVNRVDGSVDIIFHGLTGINSLIYQLTLLRNEMLEKATACNVETKGE
jgi:hypothetical protein